MKWQQRVRVVTGLSYWQIMLHLLVTALLVVDWMSKILAHVSVGLCALYCVTVVMMLVFQCHPKQRRHGVADVLEELITTWYFDAALTVLWLLSRVLENNLLLTIAGLAILAGPAVVSLLAKDEKLHHLTSKRRVCRRSCRGRYHQQRSQAVLHNIQTRIL